jgi:hypothetical protein
MAGAHDAILQRQVLDPERLKQRILFCFFASFDCHANSPDSVSSSLVINPSDEY